MYMSPSIGMIKFALSVIPLMTGWQSTIHWQLRNWNNGGFSRNFFCNGSKVNKDERRVRDTTRVTWPQLKEMTENGHEISNHGWAHRNFAKFPFDVLKEDIMKNDSAIYANVGIMPRTYAYPNNTKQGDAMELLLETVWVRG